MQNECITYVCCMYKCTVYYLVHCSITTLQPKQKNETSKSVDDSRNLFNNSFFLKFFVGLTLKRGHISMHAEEAIT